MDVFSLTRGLMAIAIVLSLVGCSASKASQCSKLSDSVNKMRPLATKFQQEGKTYEASVRAAAAKNDFSAFKAASASSANAFNSLIADLDGLVKEIQAIDLKDETLVSLKNRYLQNTSAMNSAFKNNSSALTTFSTIESSPQGLKDQQKAASDLTQSAATIQSLVVEEGRLVADFNNYCIEQK
ncbi:hypothetical protein JOY44_07715 [Phormidium sp. CLA17]|uniref:hypothetical protein n=1 Tax=Leptolyngbya sp. Cla-17 TaxID=2803751 RepID=UPI001492AE2B|nr:hypothetical protein [Leptolyngbya sp. Cla-17]MBM0741501.1 hypothetical protein [Leptolyngbya sp. Cla-17]